MNRNLAMNTPPEQNYVTLIRDLCRLMEIRQKDLAASLKLKPSQMNLYFQGKVDMRADRLIEILKILGVDVEALLSEKIAGFTGANTNPDSPVESKILSSLGRLNSNSKKSLLKIIKILGEE